MDHLKSLLRDLGFSIKETDVYFAMLELGASSVQDIADRANISRTTVYPILEHLKERLLVTVAEVQGKTFFTPEHPERLMTLLVAESNKIQDRQNRLDQALPQLAAFFNVTQGKPKVRYFEGVQGLQLIRAEVHARRQEEMWEVFAVDEALQQVAKVGEQDRIEMTETLRGRVLIAIKPGLLPPYFDRSGIEVRTIDYASYPFAGSITLFSDTLYIVTNKMLGIVIESHEVVGMLRSLYEAVWQGAKPWIAPDEWRRP